MHGGDIPGVLVLQYSIAQQYNKVCPNKAKNTPLSFPYIHPKLATQAYRIIHADLPFFLYQRASQQS